MILAGLAALPAIGTGEIDVSTRQNSMNFGSYKNFKNMGSSSRKSIISD
jgi:hypothetical protein